MEIVITDWALDSYLDLKGSRVFTTDEYWRILRPDIELLRQYPDAANFRLPRFWGPATKREGGTIQHGYKMKWHNFGSGRVQLRLCVAVLADTAFLCQGFVKDSEIADYAECLVLQQRIDFIQKWKYVEKGRL